MQLVIPMAGSGARFARAGYSLPKPLLDVAGRPAIARLLENFPSDWRCVFVCNRDHLRDTALAEVLRELRPSSVIVAIAPHRRGPVRSVLEAAGSILDDRPVLVNYCDFSFAWDAGDFLAFTERTRCDGAVLCYRGFHPHHDGSTPYAYCREDGGRIQEVREKGRFTEDPTREYASSGSYYFASGSLLKEYCARAEAEEPAVEGEHYLSVAYNPMARDGRAARVYEIPYFLQWGTPEDLEDYLYWHAAFEGLARDNAGGRVPGASASAGAPRLLMPMAGLGRRFGGSAAAKPMAEVRGEPMFLAARRLLPCRPDGAVLVVRRELEEAVRRADPGARVVTLDAPTEGEADTALAGLEALNPAEPVLVSACDHGVSWDPAAWQSLRSSGVDLAVFGQRGYPGARRSPAAYAYLKADAAGRVQGASVKKPLGPRPQRDLLLLGTFYFRAARLARDLIGELIRLDARVNGERYLDSVVDVAVGRGLDCRVFETRAYLDWGNPRALAEYRYWHGYFVDRPAGGAVVPAGRTATTAPGDPATRAPFGPGAPLRDDLTRPSESRRDSDSRGGGV